MSNDHSSTPAALTAGQSPDQGQPVVIGSGGGFGSVENVQDTIDWKRFSKLFYDQEGYYPHIDRCQHARSAWFWFSKGAHEEFVGRLSLPNAESNQP